MPLHYKLRVRVSPIPNPAINCYFQHISSESTSCFSAENHRERFVYQTGPNALGYRNFRSHQRVGLVGSEWENTQNKDFPCNSFSLAFLHDTVGFGG